MFFRVTVETFQVSQRHLSGIFLLLFFQPCDEHTELSTPVADVVGADNLVTKEFQRTHRRVTDDGGTQVTNVHLFRYVRRGVVNHDGLFSRLGDAQTIGSQRLLNVLRQKCRVEKNVDKARACNFNFAGNPVEIQMSQHLLSQLSRRHTQFFSDSHHAVSLIVAELYFC